MESIFHKRVCQRLNELGMTQKEFIMDVGISYSQMFYYKDAVSGPSIFLASSMALELKTSLDWLMGRDGRKFNDFSFVGDDKREIWERIEIAIAMSNRKKGEVFKEAGVCRSTLINMRHGSQPCLNSLCKIADVLNVSLDWLWEGTK